MVRVIKSNGIETVVSPVRNSYAFGGGQVRSYVLDRGIVRDFRTDIETTDADAVLDGEIDNFLKASLAQRIKSRR